jgi:hypothetical protein
VDHIKYEKAKRCTLSGTEILTRLVSVLKKIDANEISLYDVAKYYMHGTSIKVWIYSVLLHGISWYNRYGFKSAMHNHEISQNEKLANSAITPRLRAKISSNLPDGHSLTRGITLRQFAKQVDAAIKSQTTTDEDKKKWITGYKILEEWIEKGKKLKYQYYSLKLSHSLSPEHPTPAEKNTKPTTSITHPSTSKPNASHTHPSPIKTKKRKRTEQSQTKRKRGISRL